MRRAALTAAIISAAASLTLFSLHLADRLPLGRMGTDLWCGWLLAVASLTFRVSYLRVSKEQLADDWADRYAFGDAASLPLGEPSLDPLLGPAAGPRCVFSRPYTWLLLGIVGGMCWAAAVFLTVVSATGHVHPHPSDLLFGLLFAFAGGIHFTVVALTAPRIYGQRTIRQAGALAHERMRVIRAEAAIHAQGDTTPCGLRLVEPLGARDRKSAQ